MSRVLEVSVLELSVLEVSVLDVSVLEVSVLEVSVLEVSVLEVSVLDVSVVEEGGRRRKRRKRRRNGGYSPKNKNPTRQCGEQIPPKGTSRLVVEYSSGDYMNGIEYLYMGYIWLLLNTQ